MIHVLKFEGREDSKADYVSLLNFEHHDEAEEYIEKNARKGKHQVQFQIVLEGERVEPYIDWS